VKERRKCCLEGKGWSCDGERNGGGEKRVGRLNEAGGMTRKVEGEGLQWDDARGEGSVGRWKGSVKGKGNEREGKREELRGTGR